MSGDRRILVIGAGVSGLTSALCLRRAGFDVTIVAERFAPLVTSVVAGALWEMPPPICGSNQDEASLKRSKAWSLVSYDVFAELADDPDTGVFMRPATFYTRHPIGEDPRHLQKINELKRHVRDFVHDAALIAHNQVNPDSGVQDAYSYTGPQIDTDAYMVWLLGEVRKAGCHIQHQRISGRLKEREAELKQGFGASAIVNCTGLGSIELADDGLYPLRGALVRVLNNGKRFPKLTSAHCLAQDDGSDDPGFIFIVPRGQDMLILGGFAEPNQWGLDIGLHNYEPVRNIFQRCLDFLPVLHNAEIEQHEPVRVGLRPMRMGNVRLEQEPGASIIHNYGHGGSGVTFSWGCAQEVVELARDLALSPSVVSG